MKTVIITGANGNLGQAVTNEFLSKGYQVVATVFNEAMKQELPLNGNLAVEVVDLGNESATADFIHQTIGKYTVVDAALMLVGGFAMGDMSITRMDDIRQQFSLNFETAYHVTRPLLAHMLDNKKGRLVYIGARPAIDAAYGKGLIAYGLSKSLLFKLAEYINETARGTNVTATVIAPSTLDTPLNRQNMPDIDPAIWVKPAVLAEILEFIVSARSHPLRETVLKVYNNA